MVCKGQLLWVKLSASLLRKEKLQSFFSGKPIIMASEKGNFEKSTFPTSLIPFCKQDLLSLLILLGLLIYPGCLDRIPVVLMSCWGHHMMSLMSLLLTLSPLHGYSALQVRRAVSEKSDSTTCQERYSLEMRKKRWIKGLNSCKIPALHLVGSVS